MAPKYDRKSLKFIISRPITKKPSLEQKKVIEMTPP